MKILHVLHGFPPEFVGGSELYALRLSKVQREHGHEVVVFAGTNRPSQKRSGPTEHEGIPVYRARRFAMYHERWDRGHSATVARDFVSVLLAERPDLVHVHQWIRLTRDLVRLARATGVPVIITAHDLHTTCPRTFRVREGSEFCELELDPVHCTPCVERPHWMHDELVDFHVDWYREDLHAELRAASAVFVPSEALAKMLTRFGDLDEGRLEVHPLPFTRAWEDQTEKPGLTRKRFTPNGKTKLRVAHWGHLQEAKGVHVLLDALQPLRDRVQLVLWGAADRESYSRRIESALEGLDVERRSTFRRADLGGLSAELAVFPSLAFETHSFVIDEAFARGMPVLVSDRGALPERVHGAGASFAPGDAAALTGILSAVLDGSLDLAAWQAAIPEPVSLEEHWRQLAASYDAVLAEKASKIPAPDASLRLGEALRRSEDRAWDLAGHIERQRVALAAQRAERERMQRSVSDFEARIAELELSIREYESAHKRLETELEARVAADEERLADLEAHRRELSRVKEDFRITEEALQEERKKLQRMGSELAELRRERDAAKVEHQERERAASKRHMELETLLAARDEVLKGFEASIDDYKALVAQLEQERERLREENRLALPLTWFARRYLRLRDRLRKKSEPGSKT